MKKLAVIAFTRSGCSYARRIQEAFCAWNYCCEAYGKCACAAEYEVEPVSQDLRSWTGEQFSRQDALIFIGAAGIAVRSIAPFLKSKTTDPAVLVMDEQARHVISLLSGHLGGANELALLTARICHAEPVITTATDVQGRLAVDVFAREKNLHIASMQLAKEVSAAVLEREPLGFSSDFPVEGRLPGEFSGQESKACKERIGIRISLCEGKESEPFPRTLYLIPRILVLGIGCKRGTSERQIAVLVQELLNRHGWSSHSIGRVASIDLKQKEEGLLAFCQNRGLPFLTYTREELAEVSGEEAFHNSAFVEQVTGIGNVCERAALRAAGQMRLCQAKLARDGVTAAAALLPYTVKFQETEEKL